MIKMKMIRNWIAAFAIALLIGNFIMFFYERPTGWIDREHSSTPAIFNPGKTFIHNTEGHGVYTADENGYFNKGTLIDSGYTIVTGASHAIGEEVRYGERFSDLLDSMMKADGKYGNDDLVVYNAAINAYYFPEIINGFSCIISEFPNSENIVIEIGTTSFDMESLKTALPQRSYSENETGPLLMKTLSFGKKLSMVIKEWVPLLSRVKTIATSMNHAEAVEDATSTGKIQLDQYKIMLNMDLHTMREQYEGNLIIVYHPSVTISNGGMIVNSEETTPVFAEACADNNIVFVDMTEAFQHAYDEDYTIPTGFSNTTMGNGHINKDGHRLMAEAIYPYLCKGDEK